MTLDSENSKNRHILLDLRVFICYYGTKVESLRWWSGLNKNFRDKFLCGAGGEYMETIIITKRLQASGFQSFSN